MIVHALCVCVCVCVCVYTQHPVSLLQFPRNLYLYVVVPQHPPEVIDSVWKWALSCYVRHTPISSLHEQPGHKTNRELLNNTLPLVKIMKHYLLYSRISSKRRRGYYLFQLYCNAVTIRSTDVAATIYFSATAMW